MRWLICGTVPDDAFPLCMGTWKVEGNMLVPENVTVCGEEAFVPSVPVERGTPALTAAAVLALEAMGGEPPSVLLAGDCGSSTGSGRLYAFLSSWLQSPDSADLAGLTFHYLFPSVDGHNRILMALTKRHCSVFTVQSLSALRTQINKVPHIAGLIRLTAAVDTTAGAAHDLDELIVSLAGTDLL